MLNYLFGQIAEIGIDYIVVDVNGIGYSLFVAHPNDFSKGETVQVFVFLQVKKDDMVLYGFKTKEEKRLFLRLIDVNGIGPKTVINMLTKTSTDALIQAIETSNTSYLKKLPGIGPKAAQQIILDLKGKLIFEHYDNKGKAIGTVNDEINDAKEALKNLGFKVSAIDAVLAELQNEQLTTEEYLRRALQLLRK